MNIRQYLNRIDFSGPVSINPETLSRLQEKHLLNVPFENLDIHNNTRIDLRNSYNKIIINNRGGFCYELNGLFYQLLAGLGFKVKMVSARVYNAQNGYGPEFDHMTLIVTFDNEEYLSDVGFGEFSLHPIRIILNKEQIGKRGIFVIEPYDEFYKVVKTKNEAGEFIAEYIFSEKERVLEDFFEMCNYHQTSSKSHFTQKRICSLPTNEGRITLTGNILKITEHKSSIEKELKSDLEIKKVLWDHFKIKI